MESESKWCNLPSELLTTISNKLNNITETNNNKNKNNTSCIGITVINNVRLRSVCKPWRVSIPPVRNQNIIIPFPKLWHTTYRYAFLHSTIYLIQPLNSSSSSFSSNCWLLRVEDNTNIHHQGSDITNSWFCNDGDNKWQRLNPLSRSRTRKDIPKGFPKSIDLLNCRISYICTTYCLYYLDHITNPEPNCNPFQSFKFLESEKVAVSTIPPFTIMAILVGRLWLFNLQDKNWSLVPDTQKARLSPMYNDVVFHKGKFYAVNKWKVVSVCPSDLEVVEIVLPLLVCRDYPGQLPYDASISKNLIVSDGELFLIDKYSFPKEDVTAYNVVWICSPRFDTFTNLRIQIHKLNEDNHKWEVVSDLDDRVFFVGDDCTYSLSAREFPALKPNCVYFSDSSFMDANKYIKDLRKDFASIGVYCFDNHRCGALAFFPELVNFFVSPNYT